MKLFLKITTLFFPVLAAVIAAGCSDRAVTGEPSAGTAMLNIRLSDGTSRGDADPANDGERIQTLRIIVLDGDGFAEHNTLRDLRTNPAMLVSGIDLPVKSDDLKTIIFVANEAGKTIADPSTGSEENLSDFLEAINAPAGQWVDISRLRGLTLQTRPDGCMDSPLAITAIHNYYIGTAPNYSAVFNIHRAAAKYSVSVVNSDPLNSHTLNSVSFDNIATGEYLFPEADFSNDSQDAIVAYRPAQTSGNELTVTVGREIAPGEQIDLPPIYLPEGPVTTAEAPYRLCLTLDGIRTAWATISYAREGSPATVPMTDLPRNTNVTIDISLNYVSFTAGVTVCPWQTSTIDIPTFN